MKFNRNGSFLKAMASNGEVVAFAVEGTELCQQIMDQVGAMPPAMVHLGHAALGALLIQGLSDVDDHPEKVEIQWSVDGPFGSVYADAFGLGRARGTVSKPQAVAESLNASMGTGILQVRRTTVANQVLATGITDSKGHVCEDLVEYLEKSEQKSCALDLSIQMVFEEGRKPYPFRVTRAFGYLLHVLPVSAKDAEGQIQLQAKLVRRWDAHLRTLGPVSQWKADGSPVEINRDVLSLIFLAQPYKEVLAQDLELFCTCSDERAQRAVSLLTASEKKTLFADDPKPYFEVNCEYCGASYRVPKN